MDLDVVEGSLHIVVFPWLAFGHMIPYLELAKALAERGHHVSFLSTPRNIQRLPILPSRLSHLIHFVPLVLPPTHGLPDKAEATSDVLPHQVQYLKKAFDGLDEPFALFIREASPKPDWILLDFTHHWAPPIASSFGVPCIYFSIYIAALLAFFGPPSEGKANDRITAEQLTKPPKWINFPTNVACRLHEARILLDATFLSNASGASDVYRYALTVEGCKGVAVRTCTEFESNWLELLRDLYHKPVIPVGILAPQELGQDEGDATAHNVEDDIIFQWLDKQAPKSVLYVAFGSEARLSAELVRELALGLELSKLPFLWALRRPTDIADDEQVLPEGFEEGMREKGVVTMGWIPQLKVLAHPSIGGFLTHCGWSSVIESLQFGHPLILLPIFADQGINTRVMEEKRIGFEVQRDEDGSFTKETVANAVRLVMVEEEGEPFRQKTKQMTELFCNKTYHESYVDEFVQFLKNHKEKEG